MNFKRIVQRLNIYDINVTGILFKGFAALKIEKKNY